MKLVLLALFLYFSLHCISAFPWFNVRSDRRAIVASSTSSPRPTAPPHGQQHPAAHAANVHRQAAHYRGPQYSQQNHSRKAIHGRYQDPHRQGAAQPLHNRWSNRAMMLAQRKNTSRSLAHRIAGRPLHQARNTSIAHRQTYGIHRANNRVAYRHRAQGVLYDQRGRSFQSPATHRQANGQSGKTHNGGVMHARPRRPFAAQKEKKVPRVSAGQHPTSKASATRPTIARAKWNDSWKRRNHMQAFRAQPAERMASVRYAHLTSRAVAATKAIDHHKAWDRQQMSNDWYRQQRWKSYYEHQNGNHAAQPQHNPKGSPRHRKRNDEQEEHERQ